MQLTVLNYISIQCVLTPCRLAATQRDLCDLSAAGLTSQAGKESEVQPLLQLPLLLGQVSAALQLNGPRCSTAVMEMLDVAITSTKQTNNEAACSAPHQSCAHQLDPTLRQIAAPDATLVVETAK